jgi:UDP-N-acetylmuramate dehydrogenase
MMVLKKKIGKMSLDFCILSPYTLSMKIPASLLRDHDITYFSAFKTPLVARYFFEVHTSADIDLLHEIFLFGQSAGIPILSIGGGTNCLFACDVYEGIIIRNRYIGWEILDHTVRGQVRVNSGESTNLLSIKLYEQEITALIPWVGLPGTMGGATLGNAGCFGLEMADIFVQSTVLDLETGERVIYQKDDMHYEYRESILKGNPRFFIISTLIDVSPRGGITSEMTPDDLRALRKAKQPAGFSCGSFFKNPTQPISSPTSEMRVLSAGRIIDEAGLK